MIKPFHKTLLVGAIAAVIAPSSFALEAEKPNIHASFDVSLALKIAEENAFAVDDAPGDQNFIGLDGEVGLDNGASLTYAYYEAVDLADGAGFGDTYEGYLGYKMDAMEVRGGTLHSPLRRVLEKSDVFSRTYADANNVFLTNTIANNAVMLLGGTETLIYAVSIDFSNEDSNDPNASDGMRIGAMVDIQVSDTLSVAAGLETRDDYTNLGVSADLILENGLSLVFGLELADFDSNANSLLLANVPEVNGAGDVIGSQLVGVSLAGTSPMSLVVGGYLPVGDEAKIKAQIGYIDPDINGADSGTYLAVGYDQPLAETVTGYFLFSYGADYGMRSTEVDADGNAMVLATGLTFSF